MRHSVAAYYTSISVRHRKYIDFVEIVPVFDNPVRSCSDNLFESFSRYIEYRHSLHLPKWFLPAGR
jgi:hypothetical protein